MSGESEDSADEHISPGDGDIEISHIKGLLSILLEGTPIFEEFAEANQELDLSSPLNSEFLEKISSELYKETDLSCGTNTRGIPQKLSHVLRECVLMHRWCEASQVLAVCQRETTCDLQFNVWKVGMEILYSEFQQQDSFTLAERLMKLLNILPTQPLLSSYMHTEYLLLQSTLDDPEKTMRVITTGPGLAKKYRLTDNIMREKSYQSILLVYQGLLWYKLWLKIKNPSETDQVNQGISLEHVASSHLDKMTECFLSFYQDTDVSLEVRDIVILPHVRTLEYCQKFDEAKELLQNYRLLNPQNPNAHKYYYDFLCRKKSGIEEQLDVLKTLAVHVPSDPLVLTLCEHLQTKDDLLSSIKYLFDLLDYDCWKKIPTPWKKLVDILEKLPSVESLSENLDPLWSQRKTWWPHYHFLPISVPHCVKDSEEKDLYLTKAILALYLRDPQLDLYIKTVGKLMNEEDGAKITSVKMFLSNR